MTGWKTYRINDLGQIVTGRTPPTSHPGYFGDKYPFITPTDMDGRKWATSTDRYLSDEGANLLKNNYLPSGSVIVSCIGWQMGKVMMVAKPSFTNQQINAIIPHDNVNPDYLFYALTPWREFLLSLGSAAGVRTPILKKSAFSDLEITLPPLELQSRIASTLSTYDDLIGNNTRRIQILEEMAQRIYTEWFVHFHFPGHEKIKMVDSDLGKIPSGWEVSELGSICTFKSGYAFKSKSYVNDGKFGVVTIKNVHDGMFVPECQSRIDKIPDSLPPHCYLGLGDILISLTGNVGRVCIVYGENYLLNQRVAKLSPVTDAAEAFLYFMFRDTTMQIKLENIATGVAQQNLSPVKSCKMVIVRPPKVLMNAFCKVINPFFRQIPLLFIKNLILRQTRDLLLPKLINGEVDVSEVRDPQGGIAAA